MTETQLRSLDRLRGDIPDAFDDNDDYEQDILHGRAAADISHAGEVLPADDADAAVMAGLRANHGYGLLFYVYFVGSSVLICVYTGDFGGATRTPARGRIARSNKWTRSMPNWTA
jgi:hypothetical protein